MLMGRTPRIPGLPATAIGWLVVCYSRATAPAAPIRIPGVKPPGARRPRALMDVKPAVAFAAADAQFLRDAGWVVVQLPAGLTLAGLRAAGAPFKGTRYFSAHAPHTDE